MINIDKFRLLLCAYSAVAATCLQAAEWRIDPEFRLHTGYNNNITLSSTSDKPASAEIGFQPNIKFSRNTESSGLSGTIGGNFRRFPEESGLDDDNLKFSIDSFKNFQRYDYRLGLDFINDTTLETELDETGLVFGRTNRTRQLVNPGITWRINDRTSLNLNYTYSDTAYDDNSQGYVDSLSHTGQISLNRVLNERSTISLTANQTLTDNENDVLSRYTNLQAGYNYNLSETLSASLFVGARKTTTKFSRFFFLANAIPFAQKVKVDDTGSVFSASITKTMERGTHSADISRDISSSVSGRLIEVTRAGLDNTFKFSSRLSTSLHINYYLSQSANDAATVNNIDREYYTISPGLNWKLSRFWTISSNYRFKKQKNNNSDVNAIQNSFAINLTYQWPRIAISR